MHIFFSGIGGVGIGPLALIAKQAGYEVSGSDKQQTQYIRYLAERGITEVSVGQTGTELAELHDKHPVDWYVYSAAVTEDNPELKLAKARGIRTTKRSDFINFLLDEKNLKMIAIAGTHGKTTTTAMVVWLFKQLDIPVSYTLGAKLSFGDMGHYEPGSEYFVYECDEFDRNFLAYEPFVSIISGVSWDHHEIYPTREDYQLAFREFVEQSEWLEIWQEDFDYIGLEPNDHYAVMDSGDPAIEELMLAGRYNRLDAWLAVKAVQQLSQQPLEKIIDAINRFPGLHRRMEQIVPGLYSDEAHTPDKIRGAMSVATEMAAEKGQNVIVVYEPLTNRRQHYMLKEYKDCFNGAKKVYWLPSYLAREDPNQRIIPPEELISHLADPGIAEAHKRDDTLEKTIREHLSNGDMVIAIAGGGGDSLDEWVRETFKQ